MREPAGTILYAFFLSGQLYPAGFHRPPIDQADRGGQGTQLHPRGGIVKVGLGEYGTFNGHLSFSQSPADGFYYTVSTSRRRADNGWRRWNEFETTQGTLQTAVTFEDGSALESYFGYTDASIQMPGKLDRAMFEDCLRTGDARQTEGPWQYSGRYSEIFFFNSRWTREIGDFELKITTTRPVPTSRPQIPNLFTNLSAIGAPAWGSPVN